MPLPARFVGRFLQVAALAAAIANPDSSSAQGVGRPLALESYLNLVRVSNPRVSPDGRQVAYVRAEVNKVDDRWESSIWLVGSNGSGDRNFVVGSNPVWSPDGTRIAYLTRGDPEGTQIFVKELNEVGRGRQVTRVRRAPSAVRWSPDGQSLAFVMLVEDAAGENPFADLKLPGMPADAKWVENPKVVTRAVWRQDGVGYTDLGHDQIMVVSALGGTHRQLTVGKYDHQEPEWTPDSKALLFSANRRATHEYESEQSEIYSVDVATATLRQLTHRSGPDFNPVASPDGRLIAYAGEDWNHDEYSTEEIYVMNRDGSNVRQISGNLDRKMLEGTRLAWAPDGSGVYFTVRREGTANLYFASLSGNVRPVTEGNHIFTTGSISRTGHVVGTLTSYYQPEEVVAFSLTDPKTLNRLTRATDKLLQGVELGKVEEIWYPSFDGLKIHGWIVKPPGFDPSRRYPLIFVIHGGPHNMYSAYFNFSFQEHAANGYVVLYTNPRGSDGYGSKFGNAIMDAYPGEDYHDLMAGVDSVVARGYIDESNMFVYGCSGGGVLTAWVVGHTDRFAAASANCAITNWTSWVGTTDVASIRMDRPSALSFPVWPWDDATDYVRRSPLTYVKNVKTPTLLMTGVRDLRTPITQAEEYYQALKALRVPTALVRFNNEWHGTTAIPSNYLRTQLYLRTWFQKFSNRSNRTPAGR